MEIYDISIAPGQVRDIFCSGGYVYFYSGSAGGADPTITVNQDSRGQRVLLQPGQAYRMPNGETGTRWLLGNLKGQGTIIGRIVIGEGELTDNRVTGSVEVIDGGKNRTGGNGAFTMPCGITVGAGQYPYHGIFNPATSGKVCVISGINVSSSTAQAIFIEYGQNDPGGLLNTAVNKNVGVVAVSASIGRYGGTVTAAGTSLFFVNVAENTTFDFKMTEPVVVNPGYFVRAIGGTVATLLGSVFQFYEETI